MSDVDALFEVMIKEVSSTDPGMEEQEEGNVMRDSPCIHLNQPGD